MRFIILCLAIAAMGCNTSSSEKHRESGPVQADGTRNADTLAPGDTLAAGLAQPLPQ